MESMIERASLQTLATPEAARRVMIVKLSSVGDVIHALPILPRLKAEQPCPVITWVVEAKAADIVIDHPLIDELIVIDTHAWRKNALRLSRTLTVASLAVRFATHLRRSRPRETYDLQGLIKSGVISYLSNARQRIGFRKQLCKEPHNTWFTNVHRGPVSSEGIHVVDLNLSLLSSPPQAVADSDFIITVNEIDRQVVESFLFNEVGGKSFLIAINPCAGWTTKQWQAAQFAALCTEIHRLRPDIRIALTWGPGEKETAERVKAISGVPLIIVPFFTIKQLYYFYSKCDLFIGGDTGPMHLAAAAGLPTVALFGPTDPRRNGPYGSKHAVIWKRLPCSPCYKRTCVNQRECIESIPVDLVLEQTNAMISAVQGNQVHSLWKEIN